MWPPPKSRQVGGRVRHGGVTSQPLRRAPDQRVIDLPARRPAPEPLDLWALSAEQRVAAMRDGRFTLGQCLEWARRAPREVPLAPDGEFLFIAVRTPEWLGE